MSNVAIIGSGFLGLTLALRFAERGDKVTVFESSPEIGGLASVWQIGDLTWDRHYHVTLLSDAHTRKVVEELGLGDQFEWVETKTGFYTDGKLYSMSSTPEFLKFPPLGLISKFRLGATIFFASRVKDWKALEKVSVEDWLTKLSGRKTFDRMWRPLLKAKLGEAYKDTSAAFIWATIQRMYAARKSGLKKEMFGYVRGGYASILKRFEEVLKEKGVEILLDTRVSNIGREDEKFNITTDSKTKDQRSKASFDSVIFTGPSSIAAKIIPDLPDVEKNKLNNIRYQGIVCASVLMKNSLSPYYVTNITDETPFTGIIEMSALVDREEFGGNALVYLPKYVAPDDELFDKSDAEIEEIFVTALERMYPHFKRTDVVSFKISRVRQVFPLPVLNYSANLPSVNGSVPGMYIINSAHIVNGTLNVNETIQLAEKFFASNFSGAGE